MFITEKYMKQNENDLIYRNIVINSNKLNQHRKNRMS